MPNTAAPPAGRATVVATRPVSAGPAPRSSRVANGCLAASRSCTVGYPDRVHGVTDVLRSSNSQSAQPALPLVASTSFTASCDDRQGAPPAAPPPPDPGAPLPLAPPPPGTAAAVVDGVVAPLAGAPCGCAGAP